MHSSSCNSLGAVMNIQKQIDISLDVVTVDGQAGAVAHAAKDRVFTLCGCEVIEYDERTGQQEWADSLFVRDFTDSALATTPAPLEYEQEKDTTACDGMGVLLASDKSDF
jgi:hypothetical protein